MNLKEARKLATPGPLHVGVDEAGPGLLDANRKWFGTLFYHLFPDDSKADPTAELIAHCYNRFDDLVAALEHAEARLNAIPHRYEDTNFKMIREALEKAREVKT